jgi:hypothetical protein
MGSSTRRTAGMRPARRVVCRGEWATTSPMPILQELTCAVRKNHLERQTARFVIAPKPKNVTCHAESVRYRTVPGFLKHTIITDMIVNKAVKVSRNISRTLGFRLARDVHIH